MPIAFGAGRDFLAPRLAHAPWDLDGTASHLAIGTTQTPHVPSWFFDVMSTLADTTNMGWVARQRTCW
jgi:hypothetical protein